jgi:hypothetical protein
MVWWGPENGQRVAKSLRTLYEQINALAPHRNTRDDGTIGDARHRARKSDHNPDARGIVRALDVTHDPAHGCDAGKIAEALRLSQDARIKYVIWARRIFYAVGSEPYRWQRYSGSDPHTGHFHISVVVDDARADDARQWSIAGAAKPEPVPKPVPPPQQSSAVRHTDIEATVWSDAIGAYGAIDVTGHGASLPLRFPADRRRITVFADGKSITVPILDDGPWNTTDYDYVLGAARPRVERQFAEKLAADNGRVPTNRAGIDLLPATARYLGIDGKGFVDWQFKEAAMPDQLPSPAPPPSPPSLPPPPQLDAAAIDAIAASVAARLQPSFTRLIGRVLTRAFSAMGAAQGGVWGLVGLQILAALGVIAPLPGAPAPTSTTAAASSLAGLFASGLVALLGQLRGKRA